MSQLTKAEFDNLRYQSGTSRSWGGRRSPPYAFTEHGVTMLSSVLHSERAVQVNIEVVRTFVRLRRILATHEDLARKMVALEKRYDAQFKVVFDAIRELMAPPVPSKRRIGFKSEQFDNRLLHPAGLDGVKPTKRRVGRACVPPRA